MPPRGTNRRVVAPSGAKQQQISGLLGNRVTKPRTFSDSVPPVLKRKQNFDLNAPGRLIPPAESLPLPTGAVISQKRKWRLSEILKKDRESKAQRAVGQPAFVFHAPHMDSRRPGGLGSSASREGDVNPDKRPRKMPKLQSRITWKSTSNGKASQLSEAAREPLEFCQRAVCTDTPGTRSHGATNVSGGEAILYSRSMLPRGHLLLLDVLTGLESAIPLLKTRRIYPTFAAVREIVQRSTRREFNLRTLSQLAHVVPEVVAVLPGLKGKLDVKRPSGGFIIRLDDVDATDETPPSLRPGKSSIESKLGDSAARIRRSLLHKRLLAHVKEQHIMFLQKMSVTKHTTALWHHEFDLERDVEQLPAPPLYIEQAPKRPKSSHAIPTSPRDPEESASEKAVGNGVEQSAGIADSLPNDVSKVADICNVASENVHCVPVSLLEKVRARTKSREADVANAEMETSTNRSLLSKLPCTMDTISSVLRGERRSAMGWLQLITKVEKLHPRKWSREDLEIQFNAIADLASEWCKKVELKSSRGGYAFRVISEATYGKARAEVSSTSVYVRRQE